MTEHNWKPGEVALVDSWRGKGQLAFRVSRHSDSPEWCVLDGTDTRGLHSIEVVRARPLVVIDPEDREQVERLAERIGHLWHSHDFVTDVVTAALREFAAPTPPKPDEPQGLGAVVEDSDGMLWVRVNRTRSTPWVAPVTTTRAEAYDDIDVARVLSEGVVA